MFVKNGDGKILEVLKEADVKDEETSKLLEETTEKVEKEQKAKESN